MALFMACTLAVGGWLFSSSLGATEGYSATSSSILVGEERKGSELGYYFWNGCWFLFIVIKVRDTRNKNLVLCIPWHSSNTNFSLLSTFNKAIHICFAFYLIFKVVLPTHLWKNWTFSISSEMQAHSCCIHTIIKVIFFKKEKI